MKKVESINTFCNFCKRNVGNEEDIGIGLWRYKTKRLVRPVCRLLLLVEVFGLKMCFSKASGMCYKTNEGIEIEKVRSVRWAIYETRARYIGDEK